MTATLTCPNCKQREEGHYDCIKRRYTCQYRMTDGETMITRDALMVVYGMREAADIVRNFRPASACTCGSYISFHNGVPAHQPGCLVGECLELADEIDALAGERENRALGWTVHV